MPRTPEQKKDAVRRHRQRRKMESQRYRVMMKMISIYLYTISRREPKPGDVFDLIDLIEKLCVIGGADPDLLHKAEALKYKYQQGTPAGEAGVEEEKSTTNG